MRAFYLQPIASFRHWRVAFGQTMLLVLMLCMGLPALAQSWLNSPISKIAPGAAANDSSGLPLLSDDGNFVAYQSGASNLVQGQVDPNETDVFLYDRVNNTTRLVSHAAGNPLVSSSPGFSRVKAISGTGLSVLFESTAPHLIAGETAGYVNNLFLHNTTFNTNQLISRAFGSASRSNGECFAKAMDNSARRIVMACTSTDLQAGITDTNGGYDLYLVQPGLGTINLITHAAGTLTTAGNAGVDGFNVKVILDANAQWVAFTGVASNYVSGQVDTNNAEDVFVWTRATGEIQLASHIAGSAVTTSASPASLVGAGSTYVFFNSVANNLVTGVSDTNNANDVFEFDKATGNVRLLSHAAGLPNTAGNGISKGLSSDVFGDRVLLETTANNLRNDLIGALTQDVMLWGRSSDTFRLVSHANGSATTRANALARGVSLNVFGLRPVFETTATNIVAGYQAQLTNATQLYQYDFNSGVNQLITHTNGNAVVGANRPTAGNSVHMDSQGDNIVFASEAADLSPSLDGNGLNDIYVHNRAINSASLISKAAFDLPTSASSGNTVPVAISANGRFVLQNSHASNLRFDQIETVFFTAPADQDVFVYDADTGTQTLISYSVEGFEPLNNVPANGASKGHAISDDGNIVLFGSVATNVAALLNDTNGVNDVFVYENGGLNLVSHSSASAIVSGNGLSTPIGMSSDGNYILFESAATNLIAGLTDTNASIDVFLYDRINRTKQLVSKAVGVNATGNRESRASAISKDGRFVVFTSAASNLLAGFSDGNGPSTTDVYLFDRIGNTVSLVSRVPTSALTSGNAISFNAGISEDGSRIFFTSNASNLINLGIDTNTSNDVFVYDRVSATTRLISAAAGLPTQAADNASTPLVISGNGRFLLFQSFASNVIAGISDSNSNAEVFLYDWNTNSNSLFSRSATSATTTSNRAWLNLSINTDGSRIGFNTFASDVITGVNPGSFFTQVYQFDQASNSKSLISHQLGASGVANRNSLASVMSATGDRVAYQSESTNLAAWADNNTFVDAFLAERVTGVVVTPSITGNGSSSPSGPQNVALGQTIAFTLTPGVGQRLGTVSGCAGSLSGNVYTTGPATVDCTVSIQFLPQQFTLTYLTEVNGSLTGSTTQTVDFGGTGTTVTAFPNAGYAFADWSDGSLNQNRTDANVTANVTVTARYTLLTYQVLYSAGANGSIDGQPVRIFTVGHGNNAPTVNAVADAGYVFVRWSDGLLTAQRTDLNVTQSINVNAEFAINTNFTVTPQIGANGAAMPNAPQSVAAGNTTFFDLAPNNGYRIGAVSGCNGSLSGTRYSTGAISQNCTVTIAFNRIPVASNSSLDGVAEDGGSYGGNLTANDDDSFSVQLVTPPSKGNVSVHPSNLTYTYTPNLDANGADSFTFRINDGVQNSNTATVSINIAAANDAPSFSLNPAILPEHAPGTSGVQTRANFTNNIDFGPADEEATQAVSAYETVEIFDPNNVVSQLSATAAGTLSYTLTGAAGEARFNISLLDDGGFANGGNPRSNSQTLTIRVQNGTDLQVSKTNGTLSLNPNQNVVYEILVANAGPYAANGALLNDAVPPGLNNVLWSCNSIQLATCPQANGVGGISDLALDLPANSVLRFLVTATVNGAIGQTVTNTVTLTAPAAMTEINANNNTASDTDPIVNGDALVFRDGFENLTRITVPIASKWLLYKP